MKKMKRKKKINCYFIVNLLSITHSSSFTCVKTTHQRRDQMFQYSQKDLVFYCFKQNYENNTTFILQKSGHTQIRTGVTRTKISDAAPTPCDLI